MINILYIQPYASQVGGVDTVLLQLVQGLDKGKYKPVVMLPSWSPYVEKYIEAGAEVVFGTVAVFGKPTDKGYYFRNFKQLFTSMREIRKFIKTYNINLIHSHKMELMGGNIVGKWLGIPTVQTIHELPRRPLIAYQFVGLLNHLLNDKLIILCDRSKVMFKWGMWRSDKLLKIYNGIKLAPVTDMKKSEALTLRDELNLPQGNKIIITVARLSPMKGIEYLIQAAKQIKEERNDVTFIVVGDVAFDSERAYKAELIQQVKDNGLEYDIHFLGLRRDVPALLQQSDIFALPSVYDIFPTVILEAMSAGLPIVATDVGGVPEMINNEVGLLVPAQDEVALKEAILTVLAQDYKQLGKNGKDRVTRDFTSTTYVSRTVAVYEEMLGDKPVSSKVEQRNMTVSS
jgi:glycosyltransferase involved in cell wall biosynthesis